MIPAAVTHNFPFSVIVESQSLLRAMATFIMNNSSESKQKSLPLKAQLASNLLINPTCSQHHSGTEIRANKLPSGVRRRAHIDGRHLRPLLTFWM